MLSAYGNDQSIKKVTFSENREHKLEQSTMHSSLRRKFDRSFDVTAVSAARALFRSSRVSESRTQNINRATVGAVTLQTQGPEFCQNRTDRCFCD